MKMPTVAMSSPAVRTVVVGGYPIGDPDPQHEYGHEALDVVAYRMTHTRWESGDDREFMDVMVWCPDAGFIRSLREIQEERYLAVELVVCPWDPSEDHQRLAPAIQRVIEDSKRIVEIRHLVSRRAS